MSPRHPIFSNKLTPVQHARMMRLVAEIGEKRSTAVLRCCDATLEKLIAGLGLQKPTLERIAKNIDALIEADRSEAAE